MLTLLHLTKERNMEVILKMTFKIHQSIFLQAYRIQLIQGDKLQIDKSSEFVSI